MSQHRSWMFVPADSEKKLGKAMDLGADVIIVDLEDSVAPQNKHQGREMAREQRLDARLFERGSHGRVAGGGCLAVLALRRVLEDAAR